MSEKNLSEPIDELAERRLRRAQLEKIPRLRAAWEFLDSAIASLSEAEEELEEVKSIPGAVLRDARICMLCGREVWLGHHHPHCIGTQIRSARYSAERAQRNIEEKCPEALEE